MTATAADQASLGATPTACASCRHQQESLRRGARLSGYRRRGVMSGVPITRSWCLLPLWWLLTTCCLSPAAFMLDPGVGKGPPAQFWGAGRREGGLSQGQIGSSNAEQVMRGRNRNNFWGSTMSASADSSGASEGGSGGEGTSREGEMGLHSDGWGRETVEKVDTRPIKRRARFELHRTWQSVTSVDVVENGHIIGTRGGLPCRTFLRWLDRPRNVLLLIKRGSDDILQRGAELARYLQAKQGVQVLVESQVKEDLGVKYGLSVTELDGSTNTSHHDVDAVITLGGDGLLMHANWLFQRAAPIILPVNLGSLGFLLPFEYEDIYESVDRLVSEDVQLTLRMRLSCRIIRNGTVAMNLAVMNDVVVERGSSPYLASLDCFCNGQFITTVQADGIIIATPTGSTAYSMSAGGSMVHPGIQALLMTPICPHSLSFRPLLFPDSSVLSLRMPADARTDAWISFDGRFRHRLMVGDILEVSRSDFPLPTVTHQNVTADWFASLSKAFNFNQRTRQKPLGRSSSSSSSYPPAGCGPEEEADAVEPLPPPPKDEYEQAKAPQQP